MAKEEIAQISEEDDFTFGKKPDTEGGGSGEEPVKKEAFEETDDEIEEKAGDEPVKKEEVKKEEEAVIDIFASEEEKKEDETENKISFKPFASDLGIELENDSPEEFKAKINAKIESAKQEFKLDDFPDDAKSVIRHLKENGGKIEDFFNNKDIVSLQGVKNLESEQKILFVRTNELVTEGLKPEEARAQAETEVGEYSTKELKDKAAEIDSEADKLISAEVKKITGDRNAYLQKEKDKVLQKAQAEIKQLKEFVSTQTEFFGLPLSDKAKQSIIKDIETGAFDDIANKSPESSKFTAYMLAKFGKTINENLNKKSSEQNRKGYNAANEKHLNALHKTELEAQDKKSGHQQMKVAGSGKFDGFADAIGEDE